MLAPNVQQCSQELSMGVIIDLDFFIDLDLGGFFSWIMNMIEHSFFIVMVINDKQDKGCWQYLEVH